MIDFDDTMYIFTHGHAPRGHGGWAFSMKRNGDDPIWCPPMMYRDAKVWIKAHVREKHGKDATGTLYVCT
jgi:hypothetical protein